MDDDATLSSLELAMVHIDELITDKIHFTARALSALKQKTNNKLDEWAIAKILVNALCIWLSLSEHAEFTANAILVGTPLLLHFTFPEECASPNDMLIYWPCYALSTLFDGMLHSIPFYHSLKLFFFGLFFLRPCRLVEKIRAMLEESESGSVKQALAQYASEIKSASSVFSQMPASTAASRRCSVDYMQPAPSSQPEIPMAAASGPTSGNQPSEEMATEQQQKGGEGEAEPKGMMIKSHYVDTRGRSTPNIEKQQPQQSVYAATPRK